MQAGDDLASHDPPAAGSIAPGEGADADLAAEAQERLVALGEDPVEDACVRADMDAGPPPDPALGLHVDVAQGRRQRIDRDRPVRTVLGEGEGEEQGERAAAEAFVNP